MQRICRLADGDGERETGCCCAALASRALRADEEFVRDSQARCSHFWTGLLLNEVGCCTPCLVLLLEAAWQPTSIPRYDSRDAWPPRYLTSVIDH